MKPQTLLLTMLTIGLFMSKLSMAQYQDITPLTFNSHGDSMDITCAMDGILTMDPKPVFMAIKIQTIAGKVRNAKYFAGSWCNGHAIERPAKNAKDLSHERLSKTWHKYQKSHQGTLCEWFPRQKPQSSWWVVPVVGVITAGAIVARQ